MLVENKIIKQTVDLQGFRVHQSAKSRTRSALRSGPILGSGCDVDHVSALSSAGIHEIASLPHPISYQEKQVLTL
jgi:hypothetical protein